MLFLEKLLKNISYELIYKNTIILLLVLNAD